MTFVWGQIKINIMPLRSRKAGWGWGAFRGLCITSSNTNYYGFYHSLFFLSVPMGLWQGLWKKGTTSQEQFKTSNLWFFHFCENKHAVRPLRRHWYGKSFVKSSGGSLMNSLSSLSDEFWDSCISDVHSTIINQAHLYQRFKMKNAEMNWGVWLRCNWWCDTSSYLNTNTYAKGVLNLRNTCNAFLSKFAYADFYHLLPVKLCLTFLW